jgi:hypothetical protein
LSLVNILRLFDQFAAGLLVTFDVGIQRFLGHLPRPVIGFRRRTFVLRPAGGTEIVLRPSWSSATAGLSELQWFSQINEHINSAMKISVRIEQRRRVGQESYARAIGPFSDSLDASYSAPLPYRNCHGALIVRKDNSRLGVQLPCDAPPITSGAGNVSRKPYAGSVIVDDQASSVRDVNGYGKGVQSLMKVVASLLHRSNGGTKHDFGHKGFHRRSSSQNSFG